MVKKLHQDDEQSPRCDCTTCVKEDSSYGISLSATEWLDQLYDVLLTKDQWALFAQSRLEEDEDANDYFYACCRRYDEDTGTFEELMVYQMDAHQFQLYQHSGAQLQKDAEPVIVYVRSEADGFSMKPL